LRTGGFPVVSEDLGVEVRARILALAAAAVLTLPALAARADDVAFAGSPATPVDHTRTFDAVKTDVAPPLEQSFESAVWQHALKIDGFENFNVRQPAKYATTAYFTYDDKNLYVGVHAEQHGAPIVATQNNDNANVLSDDHVSFSIDTSGNGSRVYSFKATPKGVHDETSSENARYAPEWTSLAKILPDGGYNVLMVIPLGDIRAQNAPVQRWKFNVVRFVAATNDEYTWAFEPTQTDVGSPQFWPTLDGIRIASQATHPKPRADVYALGSSGSDRRVFQNGIGNFANTNPRAAGIDVTVPLTNTLAFVGTLNPDFSNVEQDQTSIAPQMFARSYQEYRPFFAQGSQFVNPLPNITVNGISDSLFYTPSIGIFDRGLKLEGTSGNNSIGALNVSGDGFKDTALGYSYATNDHSLSLSAEGVFANHTDQRDATTGLGLTQNNAHSGQFTLFKAEREKNSLTGSASNLFVSEGFQKASSFFAIDYRDIGKGFNPVDGYTAIDDIVGPRAIYQYNGVGGKNGIVKSWMGAFILDRFVDHTGAVREHDANGVLGVTLKNQLSFNYSGGPSGLRFDPNPNGEVIPFSLQMLGAGYKDGTPSPVDVSYMWGPFGGFFLQQMTFSTSQTYGQYGLSFEYDGTIEKGGTNGHDTQWLRRVSLTRSFGRNTSLAIGLRGINGRGGYAMPGTNLAVSFHERFKNSDEFYVDYGTPAAGSTLHRLIAKFVFHTGGATGT